MKKKKEKKRKKKKKKNRKKLTKLYLIIILWGEFIKDISSQNVYYIFVLNAIIHCLQKKIS